MAILDRLLGRYRDLPIPFNENFLAATAGVGTDFEYPLVAIPTLQAPVGVSRSALPLAAVQVRSIMLVFSAAITGANTNFFTINVNWWRAGVKVQAGAVATIAFQAGTNAVIHAPINLYPAPTGGGPLTLQPGDSLTIARVSTGTGLASPLFIAVADIDASGVEYSR